MTELATSLRPGLRLPMSWETYDSLDYDDALRGAEYMDGALVLPPGAPDLGHHDAIDYLRDQLRPTLAAGERTTSGFAWKPEGINEEYIPDVMVFVPGDDRRRFTGLPLLCVEVTSGNRSRDLVEKRNYYAAAGLPDYWIADRKDHALRCHELRGGVLVETGTFHLPARRRKELIVDVAYAGRPVQVDLTQLFL